MNINVNVDRQDVQQLDSVINRLKLFSATRFYQEIQRGGLNAAYKVKKDAPYDTGNLRLNVKWDGKAIRSDAPYSGFLEFGTKNQKRQEYFIKNILAEVKRTIRNIETKIKRTLRR